MQEIILNHPNSLFLTKNGDPNRAPAVKMCRGSVGVVRYVSRGAVPGDIATLEITATSPDDGILIAGWKAEPTAFPAQRSPSGTDGAKYCLRSKDWMPVDGSVLEVIVSAAVESNTFAGGRITQGTILPVHLAPFGTDSASYIL